MLLVFFKNVVFRRVHNNYDATRALWEGALPGLNVGIDLTLCRGLETHHVVNPTLGNNYLHVLDTHTHTHTHIHTHTEPYSVTTIGSRGNGLDPHIPNSRRSESPRPIATIPPPSIIRAAPREDSSGSEVYYSTPAELAERGGRALNGEGMFVDTQRTSVSSGDSGKELGVRPRFDNCE